MSLIRPPSPFPEDNGGNGQSQWQHPPQYQPHHPMPQVSPTPPSSQPAPPPKKRPDPWKWVVEQWRKYWPKVKDAVRWRDLNLFLGEKGLYVNVLVLGFILVAFLTSGIPGVIMNV